VGDLLILLLLLLPLPPLLSLLGWVARRTEDPVSLLLLLRLRPPRLLAVVVEVAWEMRRTP
jgi:hypothetical protein